MPHTPDPVKVEGQTVTVRGRPMTKTDLREIIGHLQDVREPCKAVRESIDNYEQQLTAMEAAGGRPDPSN